MEDAVGSVELSLTRAMLPLWDFEDQTGVSEGQDKPDRGAPLKQTETGWKKSCSKQIAAHALVQMAPYASLQVWATMRSEVMSTSQ